MQPDPVLEKARPRRLSFEERVLYQQAHPLKLLVDLVSGAVALPLLWLHHLAPALVVGMGPPTMAAMLVVLLADLDDLAYSPYGRAARFALSSAMQVVRLAGYAALGYGAWSRDPALSAIGAALTLGAWIPSLAHVSRRRASGSSARRSAPAPPLPEPLQRAAQRRHAQRTDAPASPAEEVSPATARSQPAEATPAAGAIHPAKVRPPAVVWPAPEAVDGPQLAAAAVDRGPEAAADDMPPRACCLPLVCAAGGAGEDELPPAKAA